MKAAGAAAIGLTLSARSTALSSSPAFSGCLCSDWLTESVGLGGKGGHTWPSLLPFFDSLAFDF